MSWGVYIHIPFCKSKCGYCDFYSLVGQEKLMKLYVEALCLEIKEKGIYYSNKFGKVDTIYIGGGTPTTLPVNLLTQIIADTTNILGMPKEFSVETNPGTVDYEYLANLHKLGVNRLSLGVQSFDDLELRVLGRIHNANVIKRTVDSARHVGFSNISLDLMYGLPMQTIDTLKKSIDMAIRLEPEHISIYGLQIEEGTPFFVKNQNHKLGLPEDDMVERMYDYITEYLPIKGYSRYEISNFAKFGYESQHNLAYWNDKPYLGIGASAHSYLEGKRLENVSDIQEYIYRLTKGNAVTEIETIQTMDNAIEEFCFLALRTSLGIDEIAFANKFNADIDSYYRDTILDLVDKGLINRDCNRIYLTSQGMKLGNYVFERFLL